MKSNYLSDIKSVLKAQFEAILADNEEYFGDTEVRLSSEQQFIREKDKSPNAIFIVWKALPATINFGSIIQPITIQAMGERNGIEKCQRLLSEFAGTYNLKEPDGYPDIKQTYTSPAVGSSFNEAWSGYRSLFFMSGTFLVSEGGNPATLETRDLNGKWVEVPAISLSVSADYALDTQATFASGDFTKSVPTAGTVTVGVSLYLTDSDLCKKALGQMAKAYPLSTIYPLRATWKSGAVMTISEARLAHLAITQDIGDLPVAQMTFTA